MDIQPGQMYSNHESPTIRNFGFDIFTIISSGQGQVAYRPHDQEQTFTATLADMEYKIQREKYVRLDELLKLGTQYWLNDDKEYIIYQIKEVTERDVIVNLTHPFMLSLNAHQEVRITLTDFVRMLASKKLGPPPLPEMPFTAVTPDGLHLHVYTTVNVDQDGNVSDHNYFMTFVNPLEIAWLISQGKVTISN